MNEETPSIELTPAARALRESPAAPITPTAKVFLDLIGRLKLVQSAIDEIVHVLPDGSRAAAELSQVSSNVSEQALELWSYCNWNMVSAAEQMEMAMTKVGLLPLDNPPGRVPAAMGSTASPVSMDEVIDKDGRSLLRLYCIMAKVRRELKSLGESTDLETKRASDLDDQLCGFMDNIQGCINIDAVPFPAWKEVGAGTQRQQATPEEPPATLTQADFTQSDM